MTTHQIAKLLSSLAAALRRAPDQTLEELGRGGHPGPETTENLPLALSTLASLSTIDKAQWIALIHQHHFPIQVSAKTSSRDVLGRLLNYLEKNPSARNELASSSQREKSGTSPELLKALQFLLDK